MMIACVLRSGGDYRWEDVLLLYSQLKKHGIYVDRHFTPFVCFTDLDSEQAFHPDIQCLPLMMRWPGWWSKMELFNPDLMGSILYFDLDTMIVRDFPELIRRLQGDERPAILTDYYYDRVQSSMMWIPHGAKQPIWEHFMLRPDYWMRLYRDEGDQGFLNPFFYHTARRLQNVFPQRIASFKVTLNCNRVVPDPVSVVIFHGDPRPRSIGWTLVTGSSEATSGPTSTNDAPK